MLSVSYLDSDEYYSLLFLSHFLDTPDHHRMGLYNLYSYPESLHHMIQNIQPILTTAPKLHQLQIQTISYMRRFWL